MITVFTPSVVSCTPYCNSLLAVPRVGTPRQMYCNRTRDILKPQENNETFSAPSTLTSVGDHSQE